MVAAACSQPLVEDSEGEGLPDPVPSPTLVSGNPVPDEATLEHYDSMGACLAEYGVAAEYDPRSGGLSIQSAGIGQEALTEAITTCRAVEGLPTGEPTEEYLRDYYPFLMALYDCLVEEGLPVPELVTEEVFVETGGYWHPYDVIWAQAEAAQTATTPELTAAMAQCPNDPDDARWVEDQP